MWAWPGPMSRVPSSRSRARWRRDSCRARSSGLQLDQPHHLGPRRQVFEHLRLGPPQDERLDEGLEDVAGLRVASAFDGPDEPLAESLLGAEQARIDEAEQIPELREPVFDGRARADHAEAAAQVHRGRGPLGGGVLDRLGLVQDDRRERHVLDRLGLLLEQRVGADHQVERPEGLEDVLAPAEVADAETDRTQGRGEPLGLGDPVGADAGGGRDQGRALRRPVQDQGQGLDGLAQAHVVGQAGPDAPFGQAGQPGEAVHLVRTQGRLEGRGDRGLIGLDRANPLDVGVEGRVGLELADLVLPLLQADGRQRVHAEGVALADELAAGGEPLELLAQLPGQGDVLVLAQGDEPLVAVLDLVQQSPHLDHEVLIHPDFALDLEPVLGRVDRETELLRREGSHGDRIALGPLHGQGLFGDRLELLQKSQGLLGIVEGPDVVAVFVQQLDGLQRRAARSASSWRIRRV